MNRSGGPNTSRALSSFNLTHVKLLRAPEFLLQFAEIHLDESRSTVGAGIGHCAMAQVLDQVFELTAGKRVVGLNGVAANRFGHRVFADRKSTRLNSSHLGISYAVFCLKKKSIKQRQKDCVKR